MKKVFLFISLILLTTNVYAASFSVSVGSQNLTKGGSTKLTIKGSDVTGRFNISSSNSNIVSISEDRAWIENNSYTITLSALNVGTSTITITGNGVSDGSGNQVNLGSKTIKINVSLPREKSTDNNLKSLGISGYTITPEFSKDVTDYKATVPEGTKNVTIEAKSNSNYAKVSGTGNVSLETGVNNFVITVTSESGSKKNYNLVIEVIDPNPITININDKEYTVVKLRDSFSCPESFTEAEISINDTTVPSCVNEKIGYTLIGLKDSEGNVISYIYNLDKKNYTPYSYALSDNLKIIITNEKELTSFEETIITINNIEYKAYKYNSEDRYYIVYGTNIDTGEKDFYLYDSKNNNFMAFNFTDNNIEGEDNTNIYKYVSIIFGVGLFLSIICIIILNKKLNKKDNNIIDKEEIIEEDSIIEEKPKRKKKDKNEE